MNRTTQDQLRIQVAYLNKRLPHRDFVLDKNCTGWRLCDKGGSHGVSPRLKAGALREWMAAFVLGMDSTDPNLPVVE